MTRVLIVDDDESIQLTMSALLESEGYDVACAETWEDGERSLTTQAFEVVLLDRQLDDRDGLELLPIIGRHSPQARVIVMSGTPMDALPEGAHGFVTKGERFEEVLRIIKGPARPTPADR